MDNAGIVIFFFFYDDGAKPFGNSGNDITNGERNFINAIVSKFKHHRHLIWCIAEEYKDAFGSAQRRMSSFAKAIRNADNNKHVIGIHHATGDVTMDFPDDPNIDQFTLQVTTNKDMHAQVVSAVKDAKGRFHVNMSEDCCNRTLQALSNGDRKKIRNLNWSCAVAGAHAMILGTWVPKFAPPTNGMLADCRTLQKFMESTNFNTMTTHDELASGATQWVLANPGKSYIAYASNRTGDMGIKNMKSGTYDLTWIDIPSGTIKNETAKHGSGTVALKAPSGIGNETAVWVRVKGTGPVSSQRTRRHVLKPAERQHAAYKLYSLRGQEISRATGMRMKGKSTSIFIIKHTSDIQCMLAPNEQVQELLR